MARTLLEFFEFTVGSLRLEEISKDFNGHLEPLGLMSRRQVYNQISAINISETTTAQSFVCWDQVVVTVR